jgi:hypothetical protein
MPPSISIPFKRIVTGGLLGKYEDAIEAIQQALEGIKEGRSVRIDPCGKNSFKVSYCGPDGASRWSGKAYLFGEASPLVDIDTTTAADILGKYICINPDTREWEWGAVPKPETGWHSYHVADTYTVQPGSIESQFGIYRLTKFVCGDIIAPSPGLPTPQTENNILAVALDEGNNEVWTEEPLEIEANGASDPTGFVFAKPDPAALDAHSQMKASGGAVGDVLTRLASGAGWAAPEDPEGWPDNSSVVVITSVTPLLSVEDGSLHITLSFMAKKIDFNAKTITDEDVDATFHSISGESCPGAGE